MQILTIAWMPSVYKGLPPYLSLGSQFKAAITTIQLTAGRPASSTNRFGHSDMLCNNIRPHLKTKRRCAEVRLQYDKAQVFLLEFENGAHSYNEKGLILNLHAIICGIDETATQKRKNIQWI